MAPMEAEADECGAAAPELCAKLSRDQLCSGQ
jgi:hypothetical protein